MSKKREFLRALARGDIVKAMELAQDIDRDKEQDPRSMGDKMRITAFERGGVIKVNGKEFSETGFKAYVRKIRNVEKVHVALFRIRPRPRPTN